MTTIINVLDETVINRIAAGEVVERPASVVKELLENSIDAKSTYISVEIENGGKKLIRVRDNGVGMSNDDAFLALERHATSKLKTERDLIGVPTMGFRGEALASIASVSRLRLITKDDYDSQGMDILIEGGTLKKADRIGTGKGTVLEIRNLFFNAPVRAKYLKGKALEAGHVHELILKVALAHPSIGFKYSEDGRIRIESAPVNGILDRINSIFSKDVRDNLVEVDRSADAMRVHGYVAKPPYARSTMRSILAFVNKRPVKDRLVNSSLNRAFTGLMERGRYPLAVLFIDVNPEDVDVNVHPQKSEVRFLNPSKVANLINDAVSAALYESPYRSPGSLSAFHTRFNKDALPNARNIPLNQAVPESLGQPTRPEQPSAFFTEMNAEKKELRDEGLRYSELTILGRLPDSFIVLHDGTKMVLLDHHAAHERLIFDSLLTAKKHNQTVESQNLLVPRLVSLTPVEARSLLEHQQLLEECGIIFEDFGDNDFLVKATPAWISEDQVEDLVTDIVGTTLETGLKPDRDNMEIELFKTMACKSSVKETTRMSHDEIKALLADLDANNSPRVCPHGRPITLTITFTEIRRRLGRTS